MRLLAFAALLAIPLLGLGAQGASADYYCCGKGKEYPRYYTKVYYVHQNTAVFDCDAWHCETKIKLLAGSHVKAKCRDYGWCEIIGSVAGGECRHRWCEGRGAIKVRFANMWVPENCLKSYDDEYGKDNDGNGDDDNDN
jgi:hypothetical protein